MTALVIIVHVIVSIALVMIVLLQTGKGADMGAAFGGASQTLFGGAGPAPLLGKITTAAAVVFMITSLTLAYMSVNPKAGSVVKNVAPAQMPAPAAPAAPGAQPQQAPAPAGDVQQQAVPAQPADSVPAAQEQEEDF